MSQVAGERRRFPTTRVLMEAEAVMTWTERRQPGDGFLLSMNVEEATLGLDGDMAIAAAGMDGGSELLGFTGSWFARPFGGFHAPSPSLCAAFLLGLQRVAAEAPAERMRSYAVPVVDEAKQRRAQFGHGVESPCRRH